MDAVTTKLAKKKILLARAGDLALPKITQMAFGSGGVDERGIVLQPTEDQRTLNNEIGRYEILEHKAVSDTQVTYYCKIGEEDLNGSSISEIALVDEAGDIVAIKNFKAHEKDKTIVYTFTIDDMM